MVSSNARDSTTPPTTDEAALPDTEAPVSDTEFAAFPAVSPDMTTGVAAASADFMADSVFDFVPG